MSHELRTPLNAILGFADLLRGQFFGPLNEKQLAYVNQLDASGKHLLALINDLLDMAKIDAGAMDVVLERFAPREMFDSTMSMLSAQFRRKHIETSVEVDPVFDTITGDLRKCKQIMLNLLSNAVKYTPEHGRVDIRATRERNGWLRVTVTDTGVGIANDQLEKVFSEFHQADRARDEQLGGTGIGLALTRRLVELHGGSIGVDSELGKGSTFWFVLPQPDNAVVTPVEPETVETVSARSALADFRILVAEDNEVNLSMILDMLHARGYQAVVARNGQEAVNLAQQHEPDLILMDIRMPVMDGLEATARIRSIPGLSETPIVALTASAGLDSEERCLAAGCTAHLAKPIQTRELFAVLRRYLLEQPL
jgi:CheY-like chemotaxis protein